MTPQTEIELLLLILGIAIGVCGRWAINLAKRGVDELMCDSAKEWIEKNRVWDYQMNELIKRN